METITINGEEKKSAIPENPMAKDLDGMAYCIVRTYSAGVFAGYVGERNGKEATIYNARRLWYWDGAASLSELAMHGVAKPQNCKFPCELPAVTLTEIIEVIPASKEAEESIKGVPEWKMR